MNILSPNEDKIIVELSAWDMREMDIDYEKMDYASIDTRRVIWSLLERAGEVLGRDIDPSRRMLIEAVPELRGGCVFCFTLLQGEQNVDFSVKESEKERMIRFENEDMFLDCLLTFCARRMPLPAGTVFCRNGEYRLITESPAEETQALLREFGRDCNGDKLALAKIREHWEQVGTLGE